MAMSEVIDVAWLVCTATLYCTSMIDVQYDNTATLYCTSFFGMCSRSLFLLEVIGLRGVVWTATLYCTSLSHGPYFRPCFRRCDKKALDFCKSLVTEKARRRVKGAEKMAVFGSG